MRKKKLKNLPRKSYWQPDATIIMRFFIDLSYCGSQFNGWQNQKHQQNSRCVQEVIENAFSTITRINHEVTGCGRTDTGVHARHYIAHIDSDILLSDPQVLYKINQFLPSDIVIHDIFRVKDDTHARFDAVSRSYSYHMHLLKSPFPQLSFQYPYEKPDVTLLQSAANILLTYQDFYPFCKTKTDVKTTKCSVSKAVWSQPSSDQYVFQITADRFLRGMVRLIVGMCLDVSRGRLTLDDVSHALDNQTRLHRHWSVPAIGLFLENIQYPEGVKFESA